MSRAAADRATADLDLRDEAATRKVPGGAADQPHEIPRRGWFQVLRRAWREAKADQVPLVAAGVAFYAFLALFPAIIAAVLLYGLVATPEQITSQIDQLGSTIPAPAKTLLQEQMTSLVATNQQALGIGLIVALLVALWSAAGGMGNLITAVNITYDEDEDRGFVARKALSLVMTLGAIVFVVVAITLVGVFPAIVNSLNPPIACRWPRRSCAGCCWPERDARALGALPGGAGPGRAQVPLGLGRCRHGHHPLAGRLARVLALRQPLLVVRQDLRQPGRRRGPAALAVDHQLRGPARRGDQRRGRAADRARHHDGRRSAVAAAARSRPTRSPATRRRPAADWHSPAGCSTRRSNRCSNRRRAVGQLRLTEDGRPGTAGTLPLLPRGAVTRTFDTPEFPGMTFHEVTAARRSTRCPRPPACRSAGRSTPTGAAPMACVYCFARKTHKYLDLDTGHDFDSQIVVKVNAPGGCCGASSPRRAGGASTSRWAPTSTATSAPRAATG